MNVPKPCKINMHHHAERWAKGVTFFSQGNTISLTDHRYAMIIFNWIIDRFVSIMSFCAWIFLGIHNLLLLPMTKSAFWCTRKQLCVIEAPCGMTDDFLISGKPNFIPSKVELNFCSRYSRLSKFLWVEIMLSKNIYSHIDSSIFCNWGFSHCGQRLYLPLLSREEMLPTVFLSQLSF